MDQSRLTYASTVTDAQGELLHVIMADDERYRLKTQPEDVDTSFVDLLMAYEDQRYYQHHGVDWLAMTRAVWQVASSGLHCLRRFHPYHASGAFNGTQTPHHME